MNAEPSAAKVYRLSSVPDHRLIAREQATLAALAEDAAQYHAFLHKGLTAEHFTAAQHKLAFAEIDRWYQDNPDMPGAPLDILKRADIDREMAGFANVASVVQLDTARRERERLEAIRRASIAAKDGNSAEAAKLLQRALELEAPPRAAIPKISTVDIFAPLPAKRWAVPGLRLGPGRCNMIAGYGASGKTLAAQAMAVAVAAGRSVWERFDAPRGRALQIDAEQGEYDTRQRYQRLALGMGIDPRELGDRLELAVMPRVRLTDPRALDEYCRACEGFDIAFLDSLRALAPGVDENESSIRTYIDLLTTVSERTGCALVLIHHAKKPVDGQSDPRMVVRGSSAIFDACGAMLVLEAPKKGDELRRVTEIKAPAGAKGAAPEPYGLAFEDVFYEGDEHAGVKVVFNAVEGVHAPNAEAAFDGLLEELRQLVKQKPGLSSNEVVGYSGRSRSRVLTALNTLEKRGAIARLDGGWRAH